MSENRKYKEFALFYDVVSIIKLRAKSETVREHSQDYGKIVAKECISETEALLEKWDTDSRFAKLTAVNSYGTILYNLYYLAGISDKNEEYEYVTKGFQTLNVFEKKLKEMDLPNSELYLNRLIFSLRLQFTALAVTSDQFSSSETNIIIKDIIKELDNISEHPMPRFAEIVMIRDFAVAALDKIPHDILKEKICPLISELHLAMYNSKLQKHVFHKYHTKSRIASFWMHISALPIHDNNGKGFAHLTMARRLLMENLEDIPNHEANGIQDILVYYIASYLIQIQSFPENILSNKDLENIKLALNKIDVDKLRKKDLLNYLLFVTSFVDYMIEKALWENALILDYDGIVQIKKKITRLALNDIDSQVKFFVIFYGICNQLGFAATKTEEPHKAIAYFDEALSGKFWQQRIMKQNPKALEELSKIIQSLHFLDKKASGDQLSGDSLRDMFKEIEQQHHNFKELNFEEIYFNFEREWSADLLSEKKESLVFITVCKAGTSVVLFKEGSAACCENISLTSTELESFVYSDDGNGYAHELYKFSLSDKNENDIIQWNAKLEESLGYLWRNLMQPLSAILEKHQVNGSNPIFIIPSPNLINLPILCAGEKDQSGKWQTFLDCWKPSLFHSRFMLVHSLQCNKLQKKEVSGKILSIQDLNIMPHDFIENAQIDLPYTFKKWSDVERKDFNELTRTHHIISILCHGNLDEDLTGYIPFRNWALNVNYALSLSFVTSPFFIMLACDTGISDWKRIEDNKGIVTALMLSGARGAITPLWSVDKLAAVEIAKYFLKSVSSTECLDYHTAYQKAISCYKGQLEKSAKSSSITDNPSYPINWASFQLFGY